MFFGAMLAICRYSIMWIEINTSVCELSGCWNDVFSDSKLMSCGQHSWHEFFSECFQRFSCWLGVCGIPEFRFGIRISETEPSTWNYFCATVRFMNCESFITQIAWVKTWFRNQTVPRGLFLKFRKILNSEKFGIPEKGLFAEGCQKADESPTVLADYSTQISQRFITRMTQMN